jgi:hypothetical protein
MISLTRAGTASMSEELICPARHVKSQMANVKSQKLPLCIVPGPGSGAVYKTNLAPGEAGWNRCVHDFFDFAVRDYYRLGAPGRHP